MTFDPAAYLAELQAKPLSDLLDGAEVDLSHVGQGSAENAQKILLKMDLAYRKIQAMQASDLPVAAYTAQFDYLAIGLERSAHAFLRDLGGGDALSRLRAERAPAPEQRWYFLDQTYRRQVQQRLRTAGIWAGVVAVLLIGFVLVYQRFLAPDPVLSAKYSHQMNAEQALAEQNPWQALDEVNRALALGEDADLLILRGVIEAGLDQTEPSAADFARAEALLGSREAFLLMRAETWLRGGQFEKGRQDTLETLRINPSSATGYFYLGRAYELLRNYSGAVEAYTQASKLAEEQGKIELNATIRVTLAMLIQSIPPQLPTPQPTPQ